MTPSLLQRLSAVGLDPDAIHIITKLCRRTDVPTSLADEWAAVWDGQTLDDLAKLSPADRQHVLAQAVDGFLQAPVNRLRRAIHAAGHPHAPDLRLAGELATDLQELLIAFGRDVCVPTTSPFTGKVKYAVLTDLDVVTTKAVIEVTGQANAAGKVAQLNVLHGPIANPLRLPVFHYMPNVMPTSGPARALCAAGSAGVYNDRAVLVAAVRSLP